MSQHLGFTRQFEQLRNDLGWLQTVSFANRVFAVPINGKQTHHKLKGDSIHIRVLLVRNMHGVFHLLDGHCGYLSFLESFILYSNKNTIIFNELNTILQYNNIDELNTIYTILQYIPF